MRLILPCWLAVALSVWAAQQPDPFVQTVKPFVAAYCVTCHTGAQAAAQFDLKKYTSAAQVAADHAHWALVSAKLKSREMPPKGMKQPTDAERDAVITWIDSFRAAEARKNAGDPGLVLARRLSNAEYNYSIRDLTGVDLRPTREFPVDPTNQDGFDNSGESLTMSPALLNKYLQAAREVANHLVLQPRGFTFAPHPMLAESDREKYTIRAIVDFYDRQPTDFAAYFQAAWKYKHRAALQQPAATLDSIAQEAKISPRYLPLVWGILEETRQDVGPVAKLQLMWRMLPRPEHKQAEAVEIGCQKMRDYVIQVRKLTSANWRSPRLQGLSGTSQPLMNWKLRAYAANRRKSDSTALQVEGEPPLEIPRMGFAGGVPTEDQVANRNAALTARLRAGDPELLVPAGQREQYLRSFEQFAHVFPDAFYIRERGRFYPDDSEDKGRLLSAGFHNVMGYLRDDTPLQELILDDAGRAELDFLWMQFDTVADQTTRTYVQFFFNQSGEIDGRGRESGSFRPSDTDVIASKTIFGIRDTYLAAARERKADALAIEAINEHFERVNATIRAVEKARADAEPTHLAALKTFAAKAYRRPLTAAELAGFDSYYQSLRQKSQLTHEDAMRDLVVMVLMSPDFFYHSRPVPALTTRKAAPPPVTPLNDLALASRLSYFLWSSLPDAELLARAQAGDLHTPAVLQAQVKRMLADPRSQALSKEFAGNWLGYRRFEDHNSVDRTRFPEFTNELRQAMFEEPVRFIDDLIRGNRSMLDALYGKHTFVNRVLARHYGIESFRFFAMAGKPNSGWVRIDNARQYGRGGLLPMAAFLTKNSPGLRTSPVKRGYWVAKTLLGEPIPPPPPAVPELPSDEAKMDAPLRQMLAQHRANASCAGCHRRFDGLGLAFEGYGPVGEARTKDLANRPVDTMAELPDGSQVKALEGLLGYIKTHREKDFVNTLCRKLLAYALGRSLQLSDEPLLERMTAEFTAKEHRFAVLIESIAGSPQFLNQRNPEFTQTQGGPNARAQIR